MFIRFVTHERDSRSGRRQGLFMAMQRLRDSGALNEHEEGRWDEIRAWFNTNLERPTTFSRSRRPNASQVTISWFKDDATSHIAKMHEIIAILREHDVAVEIIRSVRPGYIVYEDDVQISAQPFRETAT
jgi:hypothetical protein